MVLEESGGSHGVRDEHAIKNLAQAPRQSFGGQDMYPLVFEKAAVYVRNILFEHPFVDGNKRTGITVAFTFLNLSGYEATAKKGEIEQFAVQVIEQRLDIAAVADWLKRHTEENR